MAQLFQIEPPTSVLIALVVTAVCASIGTPRRPRRRHHRARHRTVWRGHPTLRPDHDHRPPPVVGALPHSLKVTGDLVACVGMDRFVETTVNRSEQEARATWTEVDPSEHGDDVVV